MSMEVLEREMIRARWRRARQPLLLLDPYAEDFATGGLARRVNEPSVRLLILPPDPEDVRVEFDEDFWKWWKQPHVDPASGRPEDWGPWHEPPSAAAVSFVTYRNRVWDRYLALHRHGGLEMVLDSDATYQNEGKRGFRLTLVVGRVWAALSLYREVVGRHDLYGPWEVSLSLRGTKGAILGNVRQGWNEPGKGLEEARICTEPGLLLRREVAEWPDADGIQLLAYSLGAWMEDSWGYSERRFLDR